MLESIWSMKLTASDADILVGTRDMGLRPLSMETGISPNFSSIWSALISPRRATSCKRVDIVELRPRPISDMTIPAVRIE